jgi:acyl carrier protein
MTAKDQTISRDELMVRFREIASEVAERDIPLASEDTAISALGIDSLGMLEIVGSMEREFQIRIPDDQLVGITTVRQLVSLVQDRVARAASKTS